MADRNAVELETDEVFLGLTRPATVLGIPMTAFVFEVLLVAFIFLAIGNVLWLFLFVPVHGMMFLISSSDPGRFSSWAMFFKTFGRCMNLVFWKSASYSPLRMKRYNDNK